MDIIGGSIMDMPYVDFISLVRETNRPPGGKRTVRRWIEIAFIDRHERVLEVGSNTGFTSLEIARVARCRVVGIDVSATATREAQIQLASDDEQIRQLTDFGVADARLLPFSDNAFDVVVCGGALSFILERGKALREILRVLDSWGFICVAPLCYRELPPTQLSQRLSRVLGFEVPVWQAGDWERFFAQADLEIYYKLEVPMEPQSEDRVDQFAKMLSQKEHLPDAQDLRGAVYRKAIQCFSLFNENHQYLSFLLAVLRKRTQPEEMELFEAPHDIYP